MFSVFLGMYCESFRTFIQTPVSGTFVRNSSDLEPFSGTEYLYFIFYQKCRCLEPNSFGIFSECEGIYYNHFQGIY